MTDERLYRFGAALETALLERWGGPLVPPDLVQGAGSAPTLAKEALR
jgi:hypothetical protein